MKQFCDIPGAFLKQKWKLKVLVHAVSFIVMAAPILYTDDTIEEWCHCNS